MSAIEKAGGAASRDDDSRWIARSFLAGTLAIYGLIGTAIYELVRVF